MSRVSEQSLCRIYIWFGILLALHVLGMILCLGLPLLMAIVFDAGDRSLTYFTHIWLMFGLFICPAIIGLVLPTTIYYSFRKNVSLIYIFI